MSGAMSDPRIPGWATLLFLALGVANALRFVRAAGSAEPLAANDWMTLALSVVFLLGAAGFAQLRRRAAAQRPAAASNTGRPST